MKVQLRDYQQSAVDLLRGAFAQGRRAPLLVLPTGGGKTVCFCYVAEQASAKGRRALVLVHRQELLRQCSAALDRLGVQHGLIAAGCRFAPYSVQVASVQTLVRRMDRLPWQPDLIIVDEAHHAVAGSWRKVLDRYSSSRVLGVTATPVRLDGKGLTDVFDSMVIGPTIADLTAMGFLSPTRIYAPPTKLNLKGIRTRGGDYDAKQVAEAMDAPSITGDAVEHYRRICPGVPAIAFCATVDHAKHVAEQFRAAGFRAESLDGSMDSSTRARLIDDLGCGRLNVLTSCEIVSEGTDIPVVTAAILLRPTKSEGLYLQQVGRVLRPAEGKSHAIILDHVGNVLTHGLPEEDREWSLDGTKKREGKKAPSVRQCPKCFAAHLPAPNCPACGHQYVGERREIQEVAGELIELDRTMVTRQRRREQGSAQTLEQLIQLGRQRGYKNPLGWAQHVYSARRNRAAVGWA
ncbi:MAG: DEAD/DEAH box helicase [Vulcanococcus sp.]